MSSPAPALPGIDVFSLRSCLARFATGVAVVAVDHAEGRAGLTVNSFTAVSLDPPLVLVSILKSARSHDLFPGRGFTVNVLGAEQEGLAWHFAGRPLDDPVQWVGGDAPHLAGALAVIDCAPWATYDGGDHTLVLGEVREFRYRDGDGLGWFCGRFVAFGAPVAGIELLFEEGRK